MSRYRGNSVSNGVTKTTFSVKWYDKISHEQPYEITRWLLGQLNSYGKVSIAHEYGDFKHEVKEVEHRMREIDIGDADNDL